MRQLKAAAVVALLSTFCTFILLTAAYAVADQPVVRPFDIGPQSLATALSEFARQSQEEILFSPDVVSQKLSSGVRGNMRPLAALQLLLKDSGLAFTTTPNGAVLIGVPAGSAFKPLSSEEGAKPTAAGSSTDAPSNNDQKAGRSFWGRFRVAQADPGVSGGSSSVSKTSDSNSGQESDQQELGEVIVTGTRLTGLKAADSAAPVQIVDADALARTGQPDLIQSLAQNVPSFNFSTMSGDTANLLSYIRLRGVSPNDTLVLVDGKRRHGTADLVVDGGPFQGGAGADLSLIPVSAIDHVEVLTDGAAAQYGTDAIAGVINIILKHRDQGGTLTVTGGQYFDHQGQTADVAANVGLAPVESSYLNLTAEAKYHGHSDHIGPDPLVYNHDGYDNLSLYPNVVNVPGYPNIQGGSGDPLYRMVLLSFNCGYNFADGLKFYSFGTFGYRNSAAYQNYRLPNKIPAVWPLGFNPIEELAEYDFALTTGIKGSVFGGWNFDLSSTYGSDNDTINVDHSANVSLFQDTGFTPTFFNAGAFVAGQWTTTLDISRDFDVGMASPLNVAFGAEGRHDTYQIKAGDAASRYAEGSQSYSGFTLTDARYSARTNQAAYVDLALSPVERLQLDVAGRFEHYSDFGDAKIGKLTARYDFSHQFALRGTISNGFRAPTLAEEHYSATNISPTAGFVQLAPNSPGAKLLGIDGLKPETSTNYSVGFVAHPASNLTTTLDAYQIDIDKRIVGSGNIFGSGNPGGPNSPAAIAAIQANGNVLDPTVTQTGVNIFNNGADTRTRGVDMVATRSDEYGSWGKVDWSLSGAYDSTTITRVLNPPSQILPQTLLNETALSFLTTASPKYRLIAAALWEAGKWTVDLRELIYGQSSERIQGDDGAFYTVKVNTAPITNLDVSYRPVNAVKLSVGANNLLNRFPNQVNPNLIRTYLLANDGAGAYTYPNFSPYGLNGGYYYARVALQF
jgi:iron complex outermembrane receptor protein